MRVVSEHLPVCVQQLLRRAAGLVFGTWLKVVGEERQHTYGPEEIDWRKQKLDKVEKFRSMHISSV